MIPNLKRNNSLLSKSPAESFKALISYDAQNLSHKQNQKTLLAQTSNEITNIAINENSENEALSAKLNFLARNNSLDSIKSMKIEAVEFANSTQEQFSNCKPLNSSTKLDKEIKIGRSLNSLRDSDLKAEEPYVEKIKGSNEIAQPILLSDYEKDYLYEEVLFRILKWTFDVILNQSDLRES